ncbi:MAG: c-type cytochrome [Pseudomonadota bacterium]|nr:c-type cytochrome [Pseudomonadota bacterium]
MWMQGIVLLVAVGLTLFSHPLAAQVDYEDPTPSVELGAKVYAARCVLCHGGKGMGEGILPMRLKEYPNTSLITSRVAQDRAGVLNATVLGPHYRDISHYMPPFGKELSWSELESVSDFVMLLRTDKTRAYALLANVDSGRSADRKLGQQIYSTRCVLCHGQFGEGDGRMSKLLKTPPPADLTASRLPDQYLKDIIVKGGEAVGRSKHMPPWGDQLTDAEINSLMLYLKAIRD